METSTQKDYRRIQDIKDQDSSKWVGLANKMSKLITNPEKARGRLMASADIFGKHHQITQIFKERELELCGGIRTIPVGTLTTIGKTATAMVDHIEEVVIEPIVTMIKRCKDDFPLSRKVKFEGNIGTVVSHETDQEDFIYIILDGESKAMDVNIYKLKFA